MTRLYRVSNTMTDLLARWFVSRRAVTIGDFGKAHLTGALGIELEEVALLRTYGECLGGYQEVSGKTLAV